MKKFLAIILALFMALSLVACGTTPAQQPEGGNDANTEANGDANTGNTDANVDAPVVTDGATLGEGAHSFTLEITDAEGKIVLCRIDCAQNKMDVTGGAVDTEATYITKRDLKFDYNMVKYGNAIAEWDAQAKAFADYTVGKTADEVMGLDTTTNAEGYQVSTDETLLASCTMAIDGMQAAIATAANNAR